MASLLPFYKKKHSIENDLKNANSHRQWKSAARSYDKKNGYDKWRKEEKSDFYDGTAIRLRLDKLREHKNNKDDRGLLFTLNEGIHGNMSGMGSHRLHSKAKSGTKHLIEDYIDEIVSALQHIAKPETNQISFEEKLDFFHRAGHCFGSSALMLSGGGALGYFHVGVLKALWEQDLLPNVISGASAGSVFAAVIGTNTPKQLKQFFNADNLVTSSEDETNLINRLLHTNYKKFDVDSVEQQISEVIPDLTFQEAFELTGRYINITISPSERHQNSRLLNAITSPNVLIRSAVLASTAVPGVFSPVTLFAKNSDGETQPYLPTRKWVDGSFSDDLPAKRLARLFGVNHFIVSLTNPFILPFAAEPTAGNELTRTARTIGKGLLKECATIGKNSSRYFLKRFPRAESMSTLFYSLLAQNYTGNINIVYRIPNINYRRILTHLTSNEMMQMIRDGERATWPKIESIRTSTKIGLALGNILLDYEDKTISMAKLGMNQAKKKSAA